jgi:DNA-binding NarL/FixJ family response regulator
MTNESVKRKAKVLLVEDHAMFRERLAQLINQDHAMTVCGETDNIQDAMEIAQRENPDIAIVDLTLKGSSGLELIKNLKALQINLPVLALSMHEESLYAERVLAAGGRGYITKNENTDTLLHAIRWVLHGKVYLSQKMTENLLGKFTGSEVTEPAINRLADRELEVFQLIGTGRTTREIAEALNLGVTTIETYRMRIKEKLGLRNTAELQHRASVWMREVR